MMTYKGTVIVTCPRSNLDTSRYLASVVSFGALQPQGQHLVRETASMNLHDRFDQWILIAKLSRQEQTAIDLARFGSVSLNITQSIPVAFWFIGWAGEDGRALWKSFRVWQPCHGACTCPD